MVISNFQRSKGAAGEEEFRAEESSNKKKRSFIRTGIFWIGKFGKDPRPSRMGAGRTLGEGEEFN